LFADNITIEVPLRKNEAYTLTSPALLAFDLQHNSDVLVIMNVLKGDGVSPRLAYR